MAQEVAEVAGGARLRQLERRNVDSESEITHRLARRAFYYTAVRAAARPRQAENVERTPVWFMRQAGRTLPGYRAIRKRHDLFEVCRRPELCAQVTLEPVEAHGVDAAVMFADIMLPVIGMGVDVQLVENVGPVIDRPIESLETFALFGCRSRRTRCRSSSKQSGSSASRWRRIARSSASAAVHSPSRAT